MSSESDKKPIDGNMKDETKDKDVKEQEIKWDEQYDNPAAEIVLVSSDKVGFRVDAWFFKKKSDFIKDLWTLPSDQSRKLANIDLDHESHIVRAFVELVYANDGVPIKLDTKGFLALFSLCDRFQAPSLAALTSKSLQLRLADPRSRQGLDAWKIFELAAQADDPDLAVAAIRTGGSAFEYFHSRKPAHFENIPGRYCWALMSRAYQIVSIQEVGEQYTTDYYEPSTPEQIAESFKVV